MAHVYREPGREAEKEEEEEEELTLPLVSPAPWKVLRQAALPVGIVVLPTVVFNVITAILSFQSLFGRRLRLVGWADIVESVLAVLIAASLGYLIVLIARSIRSGAWRSLGRARTIMWSVVLVVIQTVIVIGAEQALFGSRDGEGFNLSTTPTLQRASMSSDGRVAYLYSDGRGSGAGDECNYRLYVAVPFSLLMEQEGYYPRQNCGKPSPAIEWTDRSVELIDAASNRRIDAQSLGGSIFVFH